MSKAESQEGHNKKTKVKDIMKKLFQFFYLIAVIIAAGYALNNITQNYSKQDSAVNEYRSNEYRASTLDTHYNGSSQTAYGSTAPQPRQNNCPDGTNCTTASFGPPSLPYIR